MVIILRFGMQNTTRNVKIDASQSEVSLIVKKKFAARIQGRTYANNTTAFKQTNKLI